MSDNPTVFGEVDCRATNRSREMEIRVMKKILSTAAVLAFAGSAFAGSFAVDGSADFANGEVAGGVGAGLVLEGSAEYLFFGGLLNVGAFDSGFVHSGAFISTPDGSAFGASAADTAFAPGGSQGANSFNRAWFAAAEGGTPSAEVGGFQSVHLAYFDPGVTGFSLAQGGDAAVQINGVNEFVNFDAPNANGYQLVAIPNDTYGGNNVYVSLIPTPGAAGLLGLAGLAAVRRRR